MKLQNFNPVRETLIKLVFEFKKFREVFQIET